MYLESLDAFVERAEELFKANPLKTRYVMKYRHCDGKLVLKVTDDDTVSLGLRRRRLWAKTAPRAHAPPYLRPTAARLPPPAVPAI